MACCWFCMRFLPASKPTSWCIVLFLRKEDGGEVLTTIVTVIICKPVAYWWPAANARVRGQSRVVAVGASFAVIAVQVCKPGAEFWSVRWATLAGIESGGFFGAFFIGSFSSSRVGSTIHKTIRAWTLAFALDLKRFMWLLPFQALLYFVNTDMPLHFALQSFE